MSPALANFLFEAANFLVLAAVLGWILFRPVRRALDREREHRSAEEADLNAKRTETDRLLEEARQARADLEKEMEKRRSELLGEATQEARRIREEARQQEAGELRKLASELASTRAIGIRALAEPLGRIAGASLRALLETLDGPPLDAALVRAACRTLRGIPEGARAPATVEAARPLEPEAHRMLGDLLGPDFEVRVVHELGAGVRVTTPGGQVDASALGVAREAAEQLEAQLDATEADTAADRNPKPDADGPGHEPQT